MTLRGHYQNLLSISHTHEVETQTGQHQNYPRWPTVQSSDVACMVRSPYSLNAGFLIYCKHIHTTRRALRQVLISRQVNHCSHRVYRCVYFLWEDAHNDWNFETKMAESQPSLMCSAPKVIHFRGTKLWVSAINFWKIHNLVFETCCIQEMSTHRRT